LQFIRPTEDSAETESGTESTPRESEILQLCSDIPGSENISVAEVSVDKIDNDDQTLDDDAMVQNVSHCWL
jgi:hypothetical protein